MLRFNNNPQFLSESLIASNLSALDLSFTNLGSKAPDLLSSLLTTPNSLVYLNLSNNKMMKSCAMKIAEAAKNSVSGCSLREIDLSHNMFTLGGCLSIVNSLKSCLSNTSLFCVDLRDCLTELDVESTIIVPEHRELLHRNWWGASKEMVEEAARRKALWEEEEEKRIEEEEMAKCAAAGKKYKKPKKKKAKKKGKKGKNVVDKTPIPKRFFLEILKDWEEEERKKRESCLNHAGSLAIAADKKGGKANKKKGEKAVKHVSKTTNKIDIERTLQPCSWQRKYAGGKDKPLISTREDAENLLRGKVEELNQIREREGLEEVAVLV